MIKKTFAAILATLAMATTAHANDWVTVYNESTENHPSSMFHNICTYTGGYRIVMKGFCPMWIKINIVTNQWTQ